ncbi:MAG: hypothetical protein QXW39_03190 [Candidatus Bathyarchaeia archaeon]
MEKEEKSFISLFEEFKRKGEPLLKELSEIRKSVVFPLLFHSQASIAPWCISPIYDSISKVKSRLEKGENLDIILFSTGGDADTASHIAKMFHRVTKGILTFIVPRIATSAATLLTFAGNKILMSPPSELSPIDPQIEISPGRFVSARSLRETLDLFMKLAEHPNISRSTIEAFLQTSPIAEVVDYERLLAHTEELAVELLKLRMVKDETKAKEIAKKFVKEFKYHGRAITIDDCIAFGLNVEEISEEEWKPLWEFSKLWETIIFLIRAKPGSELKALEIGNGIAFIPMERAEETEEERSLVDTLCRLGISK